MYWELFLQGKESCSSTVGATCMHVYIRETVEIICTKSARIGSKSIAGIS